MMLYSSSQIGPCRHGFLAESRIRITCMFCVFCKKIDSGVFQVLCCVATATLYRWLRLARLIRSCLMRQTVLMHTLYTITSHGTHLNWGCGTKCSTPFPLDFSHRHAILSICWFALMCSIRVFRSPSNVSFFLVFRLINQFVHFMLDKFAELMV